MFTQGLLSNPLSLSPVATAQILAWRSTAELVGGRLIPGGNLSMLVYRNAHDVFVTIDQGSGESIALRRRLLNDVMW